MKKFAVLILSLLVFGLVTGHLIRQLPVSAEEECAPAPGGLACINGDVNCDGAVDMSDAISIIQWNFSPNAPELCPLAYPPERVEGLYQRIAELEADLAECRATPRGALPDTGQTKCYDDINTGNEIPCDNAEYPGQDGFYTGCQGEGRFEDNGDETVTDHCTGLMWQKNTAPGRYNWQEALQYCESLELGGHSDWRLPNVLELQSIVDYGQSSRIVPVIDPVFSAFTSWYHSATSWSHYPDDSYVVGFSYGASVIGGKDGGYYVRAVRTGP